MQDNKNNIENKEKKDKKRKKWENIKPTELFFKRKENYVNDIYDSQTTKDIILNLYMQYVVVFENNKGKDLFNFNVEDITETLRAIPTISYNVKSDVFSFINQYLNWCISKRIITINPCSSIDRDSIIKVNSRALKQKLIGKDEFFNRCEQIYTETQNVFGIMNLVFARFSIMGKDLCQQTDMRWEDIDSENKIVRIINHETGELINELKIEDDRFFKWVDKCKGTDSIPDNRHNGNNIDYIDYGYVLKKSTRVTNTNTDGEKVTDGSVYSRLVNMFKIASVQKMTLNDLNKSRRIELLLNIRENRRINTRDIQGLLTTFDPSTTAGKYHATKKLYENATGDTVLSAIAKEHEFIDENAKETTDKIREELGF